MLLRLDCTFANLRIFSGLAADRGRKKGFPSKHFVLAARVATFGSGQTDAVFLFLILTFDK